MTLSVFDTHKRGGQKVTLSVFDTNNGDDTLPNCIQHGSSQDAILDQAIRKLPDVFYQTHINITLC